MKLIKYSSNWADEMDISGFSVKSEERYKKWRNAWKLLFKEDGDYTFHIGTNEEVEYNSFEEFISDFKIKEISEEDAIVIKNHFGDTDGFFPEF